MRLLAEVRDYNAVLGNPGASEESQRQATNYFVERESAANARELAAAGAILSREQLAALKRQLDARQSPELAGANVRRLDRERFEQASTGP